MFPGRKQNDSLLITWLWILSTQPLIAVALTTVHCKQSKWKNGLPESQVLWWGWLCKGYWWNWECRSGLGEYSSFDFPGLTVSLLNGSNVWTCKMNLFPNQSSGIITWTAPELALTIVPLFPVLGNKINYSLVTEARRSCWLWKTI